MHFSGEFTFGNVVILAVMIFGFGVSWTRVGSDIKAIKDWIKLHIHMHESRDKEVDNLRLDFAASGQGERQGRGKLSGHGRASERSSCSCHPIRKEAGKPSPPFCFQEASMEEIAEKVAGNGAVRAEDYMRERLKQYEVKLPSGAMFLIRRPNLFWFGENAGLLPSALIERVTNWNPLEPAPKVVPQSAEEVTAFHAHRRKMIEDCVLQPKIRRPANKEAGEIDPADLDEHDAVFIADYLAGVVDRDGRPLRPEVPGVPVRP